MVLPFLVVLLIIRENAILYKMVFERYGLKLLGGSIINKGVFVVWRVK